MEARRLAKEAGGIAYLHGDDGQVAQRFDYKGRAD
jgi:hypothetical protein